MPTAPLDSRSPTFAARTGLRRLVAIGLLGALSACGTGGLVTSTSSSATTTEASATTTAAPATAAQLGLELFADYPRYLWQKRRLAIATTNRGATPIEVTSVGLVADHFEVLAPEEKTAVIPPGSRTDLQVDFGEIVDCSDIDTLAASVEIEVARPPGDAVPRQAVIPIDPAPLDTILQGECAQRVVTDAVDIGFADDWTVDGGVLSTELALDRRAGDAVVTASSLRGTELIGLRQVPEPTDPVAVLAPGAASAVVPVEFEVIRCDPHAVGQSSRTYDFKLWVAVGDREAQLMTLAPDDRLRVRLTQLIARCVDIGGP